MNISDILCCKIIELHEVGVATCIVIKPSNGVPIARDKALESLRFTTHPDRYCN